MYEEKVRKFKCYHCPDCNLYAGSETKNDSRPAHEAEHKIL